MNPIITPSDVDTARKILEEGGWCADEEDDNDHIETERINVIEMIALGIARERARQRLE